MQDMAVLWEVSELKQTNFNVVNSKRLLSKANALFCGSNKRKNMIIRIILKRTAHKGKTITRKSAETKCLQDSGCRFSHL
jgi:hypothetical protein